MGIIIEKYKYPPKNNLPVALDLAVKAFEGKEGGYLIENSGAVYYNYMTKEEWSRYYGEMRDCHKNQLKKGSGGELKEGIRPPKMASYGSSSRLIYELSNEVEGFSFEKKLPTRVGGSANLDGYLKNENTYIYVEAKRREIYGGSHKGEGISVVYKPVYDKIREKCRCFSYKSEAGKKKGYLRITFNIGDDDAVQYFDLKQLICHFLGIANDIIEKSLTDIKVKFLYLIYDPQKAVESKSVLSVTQKKNILERYDKVKSFIQKNNKAFWEIFRAVLDYQLDQRKHLKRPNIEFEMELVDQDNYKKELQ